MALEQPPRFGLFRAIGSLIVWIVERFVAIVTAITSSSKQSSRVQSLRISKNAKVSVKVLSVRHQQGNANLQGTLLNDELVKEISNQSGVSVSELNDLLSQAQINSLPVQGNLKDGVQATVSSSPKWKVEVNSQTFGDGQVLDAMELQSQSGQKMYQAQRTKIQTQLVVCPKCHHKTQQGQWCLYCGTNLPQVAESKHATTNEIDQKFLHSDVKNETTAENKQEQKLNDSFEDRLKGL